MTVGQSFGRVFRLTAKEEDSIAFDAGMCYNKKLPVLQPVIRNTPFASGNSGNHKKVE